MTTLAIAVLLASLVSKGLLAPRLAAIIGAVAFVTLELAFLARPTPVLLAAPILLLLLWPSFVLLKRATLPFLPIAAICVLSAVVATTALRGWVDRELLMRDPETQPKIAELQHGIDSLNVRTADAGVRE